MVTVKRRILHLLIAIDQLLWVILTLGAGDPDETISCAMYRYERDRRIIGIMFRPVIDFIFFFDSQHCRRAYLADKFRRLRLNDGHRR
jgi:hypothetical protein